MARITSRSRALTLVQFRPVDSSHVDAASTAAVTLDICGSPGLSLAIWFSDLGIFGNYERFSLTGAQACLKLVADLEAIILDPRRDDYFSLNKEMAYQRCILLNRQTSKGNRLAQKDRRKAKQAEQKALKQKEREAGIRASAAALAAFLASPVAASGILKRGFVNLELHKHRQILVSEATTYLAVTRSVPDSVADNSVLISGRAIASVTSLCSDTSSLASTTSLAISDSVNASCPSLLSDTSTLASSPSVLSLDDASTCVVVVVDDGAGSFVPGVPPKSVSSAQSNVGVKKNPTTKKGGKLPAWMRKMDERRKRQAERQASAAALAPAGGQS